MTEPRPASGLLVSAMLRRVQSLGGHGAVLSRGDAVAGGVLLVLVERGVTKRLVERGMTLDGGSGWIESGPKAFDDPGALSDYLARRRRGDPDLWVVELDASDAVLAELVA